MTTGPLPVPSKRLRTQLNTSDDPLEVGERKDTLRKTRTKECIEKAQAIIDETLQRPIWQIARCLSVSHTTVNACVKEDLKYRPYRRQTSQILTEKTKNLRLIKCVRPPPPPTWSRWTTSFGHTSRTSPTWPPTTPKPAWSPLFRWVFAELPQALVEKACSQFRIRIEAVIVATLNRYQLYYIIKLPELIFSIKVLK